MYKRFTDEELLNEDKVKKVLRYIWRVFPKSDLKAKLHCLLYNQKGFSFQYHNGIYTTICHGKVRIKTYEAPFNLAKYYKWFLKYYMPGQGNTVVDAGAYNGHVSILLSQLVGPSGRVIAFEPDPANLQWSRRNFELNKCKNIELVEKGLWTEDTVLEFNSNNSVASSVFYESPNSYKIQIPVTSLDNFFEKNIYSHCHFIKMNIEGSEIMALKGAIKTLTAFTPGLVVTTDHVVEGKQTTAEVERILNENNFKVWTETDKTAKITYASSKL